MNVVTKNMDAFSKGVWSKRLLSFAHGLNGAVNVDVLVDRLSRESCSDMNLDDTDELVAQIAASYALRHPDYSILAGRILLASLYRQTQGKFSTVVETLWNNKNPKTQKHEPLISKDVYEFTLANADRLDGMVCHNQDEGFDYFAIKTLQKSYLIRMDGVIVERPQHMFMRVAVELHLECIDGVFETYNLLSKNYYIHATPTLSNAGTHWPQLSSCFLAPIKADSVDGIYDTLKDCAKISQHSGGIGLSISNVRANGSYVYGINGSSPGIVPMLRVLNNSSRYVSQSTGGRRTGVAVYIEPWHADVFEFLELRKSHGNELERARDLFTALWVNDLFMERVQNNCDWTLMCPSDCPGLVSSWGDKFKTLYEKYENEGRGRRNVSARKLWYAILDSQVETGTPYMLYKDHINRKSNQSNLGTITCSNLCAEIVQFSSPSEVAVCNLASLNLTKFVNKGGGFNFDELKTISGKVVMNLNRVIDRTHCPLKDAKKSNSTHRPMGIGVQGLADVFQMLDVPYDSCDARELNKQIFETIYFGACEASAKLAAEDGPYKSYHGSPASRGLLQYDLWNIAPSSRWNWDALKKKIQSNGMRNSLLVASMPTASTAQVLGNSEGTDPTMSNVFSRRVNAGEFIIMNKHLVNKLEKVGLWTDDIRNQIIANGGSIQSITEIPSEMRSVFKTAWEIPQKVVLGMAADRGAFICQSQSTNVYIANPTIAKLTSMHFYAWVAGLKTGMYYLR